MIPPEEPTYGLRDLLWAIPVIVVTAAVVSFATTWLILDVLCA